ncbi:MAG: hypothetical protein AAGF49_11245 [Pseudomonadota bacterium]
MLVYIDIPMTSVSAYNAFSDALGEDNVAWVGRNITVKDLAKPERLEHYAVIGGRIEFFRVHDYPLDTIFSTSVGKPIDRVMARWMTEATTSENRFHEDAHTFTIPELFEKKHPFTRLLSNFATRFLCIDEKEAATADAALETIEDYPFLVGDPAHPRQTAMALSRVLGLAPEALSFTGFMAPKVERPRPEVRPVILEKNAQDEKLYRKLVAMRPANRKFVRSNLPLLGKMAAQSGED